MAEPTQLAFRTLKGIGILDCAPAWQPLSGFERPTGALRCSTYSPEGKFFAWASAEQVTVIDASTGHVVTNLPADNVYELGFSPLGTFIITWQRPVKDEEGNTTNNLKVWRTIDDNAGPEGQRNIVGAFVQKSQTGWNLQYTHDETFCARVVTNEVQFYESGNLAQVWNKLRLEGVSDFAVSPGQNHSVAVFVPEKKGQPAAVKVFNVPQFAQPVSQKTFFKGDKVQFKWNDLGTSLIVLASTDVDKSNKSYYGETNMYILSANGGFDSRIQLDKEGPIHDVHWSPSSKQFGVVYGYMPAKTTIFDTRANAVHTFNLGPRNTILFSPHGRFVLVAGFGNLAGEMDVYDMEKNYAKVTTIQAANPSVCEWSPDGRHILTATTSPRLRVDNGLRIYHVTGGLMYHEEMAELYTVAWKPQSVTKHPLKDPSVPAPAPHPSALAYLSTVKTPSKPAGAYRPPGARGTSTPLAFKREDQGGEAFVNNGISSTSGGSGVNGFGRPKTRYVPGAEAAEAVPATGAAPGGGVMLPPGAEAASVGDENLSATAKKNKKKREAKKAAQAAAVDGTSTPPAAPPPQQQQSTQTNGRLAAPHNDGQSRSRSPRRDANRNGQGQNMRPPPGLGPRQQQQQPQASTPIPAPQTPRPAAPIEEPMSPNSDSPHQKKLRALTKKMRAIEELKMRQAGGEKLELSQLSKIKTEEQVRKELDALELEA